MKDNIRRICVYGGPCAGKSTTAAFIFAELKKRGHSVELVDEYIKFWTYIPRSPKGFDSLYIQAKQVHKEDTILRAGTDLIVSDSPVLLQYFYALHHDTPAKHPMWSVTLEIEKMYSSLNILLTRKDSDYNELGRYETLKQAKVIDTKLENLLNNSKTKYESFNCHDNEKILEYVLKNI